MRVLALLALGTLLGCGRSDLLDDVGENDASADLDATVDVSQEDAGTPSLFGDDGSSGQPPAACACAGRGGCCQGETCLPQPAQSTAACGDDDAPCRTCAPGESCFKGSCARPETACGPVTCKGCCAFGFCFDGLGRELCGFGGSACSNCGVGHCTPPTVGGRGGRCVGPPPVPPPLPDAACPCCTAGPCVGCCVGDVCATGEQDFACGAGGVTCADCTHIEGWRCVDHTCER